MVAIELAQTALEEVADAAIGCDRVGGSAGEAERLELCGKLFKVGHDEGGKMLAAVANYAGLGDVAVGHQTSFEIRRGDIFAARQDNDFFFPVSDTDIAAVINLDDIAGMEPALPINHLARFALALVIPFHDIGAVDEEFAIV